MAFTPAGMFYLGKEDLAPTQNLIGAGARQAFGMPNQEELVDQILRKADYDTPEGRRTAINEIRKVDPEKAMEFEKMNIEHERSLILTEKSKQDVAKGKRASDGQIDNISNRLGNFIKSSDMDTWYPLVMGVPWSKDIKKPEMTLYNTKIKAFVDNYNIWIDSLNLSKTQAAELQNDSTKRTALLHQYAEHHGDPLAKAIANMFKKGVPNGNTLKIEKEDKTSTETKEDKTSTETKKDGVVTRRGKRNQFNMTAADQENEVNSSLFGGTSYA
jgi:hypothetical protein